MILLFYILHETDVSNVSVGHKFVWVETHIIPLTSYFFHPMCQPVPAAPKNKVYQLQKLLFCLKARTFCV